MMDYDCTDEELMEIYGHELSWDQMQLVNDREVMENFYNCDIDNIMGSHENDLGCQPSIVKTSKGEDLVFTRPQPTIPEEKDDYVLPYTYKCEFKKLLSIQNNLVKHETAKNVVEIHKYLNSPLNLKMNGKPGFEADIITNGIHKLEREILDSSYLFEGVQCVTDVLNPTLGCIKMLKKKNMLYVNTHYVIDSGWEATRQEAEVKEYAKIVSYCTEERIMLPVLYTSFEALPDKFFYVGYSSHLLHERRVKGVGYEFNPVAGYSVKVPILNVIEQGDHYVVTYVKKGSRWKAKYYKSPGAYRYNASVLTTPKCKVDHAACINLVCSKPLMTKTMVKVTDNYFFANCYDRVIRPVYTQVVEKQSEYGKLQVGMYLVDGKMYPSVLLYPPFEAKMGDEILRKVYPTYEEFTPNGKDYMVRSTLAHAICHFRIKAKPVKYSAATLGFDSAWYYSGGIWRLRAYPKYHHDIIKEQGKKDVHVITHDGVPVNLPMNVGEDGFYKIPSGCFVLSGANTTLYTPDELGDNYAIGEMPVVKEPITTQVFLKRRVDANRNIVHYPGVSDAIRKEIYDDCFMYEFKDVKSAKRFASLYKLDVLRNAWKKMDVGMPINGIKALWRFEVYKSEAIYGIPKPFVGLNRTDNLELDSYYRTSTYYEARYNHSLEDGDYYESGKDIDYPSVDYEKRGGLFGP